ncbi:MAG: hypothetical protein RL375_2513 [Pseudomonadota bacterium]
MSLAEFLSAASAAWALLAASPWRWLWVILVFLISVELLMFIPYVGFVTKMAVAGIVSAQVLALFAAAAAGQEPSPLALMASFSRPLSAQAALAFSALVPFLLAVLVLFLKEGAPAIQFFFGNVLKDKPPPIEVFVPFKYVMQVCALPLTLLAGAVVLQGLSGMAAIQSALTHALANWLPVLLLGLIGLAFEWASGQLPALLPKPAAAAVGGVLLILYLGWSFAALYTVSAQIFKPTPAALVQPHPAPGS